MKKSTCRFGTLIIPVLALSLGACTSNSGEVDVYTAGFNWDSEHNVLRCEGQEVRPLMLLEQLYPDMLGYLNREGVLEGNRDLDFRRPNSVGYKEYKGQQYIRFDFANPLPTADDFFDGGVTVTVNACTNEFVSAALLGW